MSDHRIGESVVLRLCGSIESTTVNAGEVRAYEVRLMTRDLLVLTPEQLAAAVEGEQAHNLLLNHLLTREPLGSHEVAIVEAAGLASQSDFDGVGGDLYRHVLLQDEEE